MKTNKAVILAALLALVPFRTFAQDVVRMSPVVATPKSSDELSRNYLDSYSRTPGSLFPVSIDVPYINARYVGDTIDMIFTVDAKGLPGHYKIVGGSPDIGLVTLVTNSVNRWRFSPAQRDGVAVPVTASLHIAVKGSYNDMRAEMLPASAVAMR